MFAEMARSAGVVFVLVLSAPLATAFDVGAPFSWLDSSGVPLGRGTQNRFEVFHQSLDRMT